MELPKQLLYLGSQLGFMEARQALPKEKKIKFKENILYPWQNLNL